MFLFGRYYCIVTSIYLLLLLLQLKERGELGYVGIVGVGLCQALNPFKRQTSRTTNRDVYAMFLFGGCCRVMTSILYCSITMCAVRYQANENESDISLSGKFK